MKMPASAEVNRVKKVAPPELPKTVWLEPPREALISAPFPDCISTTRINRTQVKTWTTVIKVDIDYSGISKISNRNKRF